MSDAIIVALITAGTSVICQMLISAKTKRDTETKQAVRDKEFEDRLENIEKRLDQHNHYAEKLGEISIALTAIKKDIEYIRGGKA